MKKRLFGRHANLDLGNDKCIHPNWELHLLVSYINVWHKIPHDSYSLVDPQSHYEVANINVFGGKIIT